MWSRWNGRWVSERSEGDAITWTSLIQASGLLAWFLLCAEMMLGVTASAGLARYALGVRRKQTLHRGVAWALLAAVGVHVGTIVASRYQGWGVAQVTELGFGTLARNTGVAAFWLLLIVVAATWAKAHIPRSWWTVLHRYGTFAILLLATVHAIYAGPGVHRLETIVPGVVALTFVGCVFIARWYGAYARRVRLSRPSLVLRARLALRQRRRGSGAHYRETP